MFLTITSGTQKSVLTFPIADADLPSFASVLKGELPRLNEFAESAKNLVRVGVFGKNYSQEFEHKQDSTLVCTLSYEPLTSQGFNFAEVGVCFSVPITIRNKITGKTFSFTHREDFVVDATEQLTNLFSEREMSEWVEKSEEDLPESISSTDPSDWDFTFYWNDSEVWDGTLYTGGV